MILIMLVIALLILSVFLSVFVDEILSNAIKEKFLLTCVSVAIFFLIFGGSIYGIVYSYNNAEKEPVLLSEESLLSLSGEFGVSDGYLLGTNRSEGGVYFIYATEEDGRIKFDTEDGDNSLIKYHTGEPKIRTYLNKFNTHLLNWVYPTQIETVFLIPEDSVKMEIDVEF